MSLLQFETQVSPEGVISLPPIPELHGRKVVVSVKEERTQADGTMKKVVKTPEQDFLDFCEELDMPSYDDNEVDQMKYERFKKKYL